MARSPCSTKTSPLRTARLRPCVATRSICTEVSVGKIWSAREDVSGSGVIRSAILTILFPAAVRKPFVEDPCAILCCDCRQEFVLLRFIQPFYLTYLHS